MLDGGEWGRRAQYSVRGWGRADAGAVALALPFFAFVEASRLITHDTFSTRPPDGVGDADGAGRAQDDEQRLITTPRNPSMQTNPPQPYLPISHPSHRPSPTAHPHLPYPLPAASARTQTLHGT
ncbi:hypothetical protein V497_05006 [Pseudogymnoascus sp. VKM F-4516 (FW-969)]|nr:hypothetical protein V497_05006 [Pseudogymnoascus sp. VKM F-4516 (FW-969)]